MPGTTILRYGPDPCGEQGGSWTSHEDDFLSSSIFIAPKELNERAELEENNY